MNQAGLAFAEFSEQNITFAPTYKYMAGCVHELDTKKGVNSKVPSYTDRIWYEDMVTPNNTLQIYGWLRTRAGHEKVGPYTNFYLKKYYPQKKSSLFS